MPRSCAFATAGSRKSARCSGAGAEEIDGAGRFLIPGLIDSHVLVVGSGMSMLATGGPKGA
jgi:predicted amidohydrolase YtcJ